MVGVNPDNPLIIILNLEINASYLKNLLMRNPGLSCNLIIYI